MKRLVLLLCLCLLVVPVLGIKENFQDWGPSGFVPSNAIPISYPSSDRNTIVQAYSQTSDGNMFLSNTPTLFTYAAFDTYIINGFYSNVALYDSSFNILYSGANLDNYCPSSRYEIKIIGGTPSEYCGGVLFATGSSISVNPSYIGLPHGSAGSAALDNLIIGESDHHITGSLPINWSIQRDLINPAATGVYAWNPTTNTWVLKNSFNFYVVADKEFLNPEVLSIRHSGGTVINATTLTPVHNQVQYNLTQFLTTSTAVGTTVPDGQYSVSWNEMSPPNWFADTFWVTSNGGIVNWNADKYSQGSTATITYAISNSYFLPTSYTYNLVVQNIYGTVITTIPVNTQTGSSTITLSPETYPAMVYNVLLQATKTSDSSTYIMNYDGMEITGYVYLEGTVLNAETTLPISGVSVNVSQGTTSLISTTGANGIWNSSGSWLTGSVLSISATGVGYEDYANSFTPLVAKTIPITIPMMPIAKTCTGVCIGGLVNDTPYHNPVVGATYHVRNGTELTATTNAAGYARVDSLTVGLLYDVWSTKVGYSNSTVHQLLAVGV